MATDDFERSESPLDNGTWVAPDGQASSKFTADGHFALPPAAATIGWMYYAGAASQSAQFAEATLGGSNISGFFAGVAVNIQNSGQSGYFFGNVQGSYVIQRVDSGTRTTIATGSGTPSANDVMHVENNGSGTITGYVNGVQNAQATGETTYSGGQPGIFGYGAVSVVTLDNWSGANLAAAAVVVDWLPTQDQPAVGRKLSVVAYGNMPGRN